MVFWYIVLCACYFARDATFSQEVRGGLETSESSEAEDKGANFVEIFPGGLFIPGGGSGACCLQTRGSPFRKCSSKQGATGVGRPASFHRRDDVYSVAMWLWKPQQVFGSILSTVWDSLAGPKYSFPSAQTGYRVVGMGVLYPYGSFGGPVEGQYKQALFPKEKAWWMGRAAAKGQAQRCSQRGQVRWQGQVGDTRCVPFGPPDRKLASSAVGNGTSAPEEGGGKQRCSSLAGEDATGHFSILACRGGDKCAGASEGSGGRTPAHCHTESDEVTTQGGRGSKPCKSGTPKAQSEPLSVFGSVEGVYRSADSSIGGSAQRPGGGPREVQRGGDRLACVRERGDDCHRENGIKDQAISEEDQEMEDGEFRASEAAETEARLQKETEEHQSAGRNLHNALQVARQQAAEHLNKHQREGSRTPRRKNDVEPEGQQVDKAKEEATGKPSGGSATTPFKLGGSQAQAKSAPRRTLRRPRRSSCVWAGPQHC